jgi:hypothetical protein
VHNKDDSLFNVIKNSLSKIIKLASGFYSSSCIPIIMSESEEAKQIDTTQADQEAAEQLHTEEKKERTSASRSARKLKAGDSARSEKILQDLQDQISKLSTIIKGIDKQVSQIDEIQSQVNDLDSRISQIQKVSQDTLGIVQRIKLKKKKGKGKK